MRHPRTSWKSSVQISEEADRVDAVIAMRNRFCHNAFVKPEVPAIFLCPYSVRLPPPLTP